MVALADKYVISGQVALKTHLIDSLQGSGDATGYSTSLSFSAPAGATRKGGSSKLNNGGEGGDSSAPIFSR